MIKARIDTLIPVYNKLFNSILTPGTMPDRLGVVIFTPIYWSDARNTTRGLTDRRKAAKNLVDSRKKRS